MRRIALSPVVIGAVVLCGCAQTVFYDRHTGKAVARFQGDMTGSHYGDAGTVWDVRQVSHSSATVAGGQAFSRGANAVGTAGAGLLLAAGSSGLFPAAASVGVPAVAQFVGNTASPKPASKPAANTAH